MAKIFIHPKNKEVKLVKKHIQIDKEAEKYKSRYQTFFFLFIASVLTNVFLFALLAHNMMVK